MGKRADVPEKKSVNKKANIYLKLFANAFRIRCAAVLIFRINT
jgi:hypothetical protein